MWGWRIYFVLVVGLEVFSAFDMKTFRVWEGIDIPITLLSFVGLFGFAWKKAIFKPLFWKNFLIILTIWNLLYLFVIPVPAQYTTTVSQTVIGTTFFIIFSPLLIALYFYAFPKTKVTENEEKKKVPVGIKVITVCLISLIIFPFLVQGLLSGMKQGAEHMNREEKIKMIQTPYYKEHNVLTVEDFDKYVAKQSNVIGSANKGVLAASMAIICILLFGLWQLKEWGRLGMIIFSIYRICWEILSFRLYKVPIAHIIGNIVFLAFSIWVVTYLIRPKVKDYFKSIS